MLKSSKAKWKKSHVGLYYNKCIVILVSPGILRDTTIDDKLICIWIIKKSLCWSLLVWTYQSIFQSQYMGTSIFIVHKRKKMAQYNSPAKPSYALSSGQKYMFAETRIRKTNFDLLCNAINRIWLNLVNRIKQGWQHP